MVIDRYMNGWSWKKICLKYHYEYEARGAQKAINAAIKKWQKIKVDTFLHILMCYNGTVEK